MRKFAIVLAVSFGLIGICYAEHPTAEHPVAVQDVNKEDQQAVVEKNILALIASGMTAEEAKKIVDDMVAQAKDQGLSEQEIIAKLNEATSKISQPAEEAAAAIPMDHPAH